MSASTNCSTISRTPPEGGPAFRWAASCARRSLLVASLLLGLQVCTAEALPYECGSLENAYGPYDYTNPVHVRERLPIVEGAHFTREVESLRRGHTSSLPGSDLDYTLRAFPNHHRALFSMLQYFRMFRNELGRLPEVRYPAHCWFERAVAFAPTDGMAHLLKALYLSEVGEHERADRAFERAIELNPDSPEVHYNYGLMLERRGRYEAALKEAHRAYELGFPLPGLRNKLKRAGAWVEPEADAKLEGDSQSPAGDSQSP